jgi:hypothetical protein
MTRLVVILSLASLLTSCASVPEISLDQRLMGKSDKEARTLLAYACYREAEWPTYNSAEYKNAGGRRRSQMRNNPGPEVKQMLRLCGAMRTATDLNKVDYASDCRGLIAEKTRRYGSKALEHVRRVRDICSKMTGQPMDDVV